MAVHFLSKERLGFPDYFVRWFEVLQKNRELRIYNNGHSSAPIFPSKGVAQGSGLSPIIFIIAMSRLGDVISKNLKIKGITYNNVEKKYDMAADDTALFLQGSEETMKEVISVLLAFTKISGLKINFEKSVVIKIGNWEGIDNLSVLSDFRWVKSTTYLGVEVSPHSNTELIDSKFTITSVMIQGIIGQLRYSKPSILGRVLLLKSLILSRFVFKFIHYPRPSSNCLKNMNGCFLNFLWDGGRHQMRETLTRNTIEEGGFNNVDLTIQQFCLRFKWISRTLHNVEERLFWEHYLHSNLRIALPDFLRINLPGRQYSKLVISWRTFPCFWKTLFDEWFKLTSVSFLSNGDWNMACWKKSVFFNKMLGITRVDRSLYWYKHFQNVGVITCEEMALVWNFVSNEEKTGLQECYSIRGGFCGCAIVMENYTSDRLAIAELKDIPGMVVKNIMSCKQLYMEFRKSRREIPTKVLQKWNTDLRLVTPMEQLWPDICRKSILIEDKKIKTFHILFLNRAYHLNVVRSKYENVSSNCSFCDSADETFIHLFWECPKVQIVWQEVIEFCKELICSKEDVMNQFTCIFSFFSNSLLVFVITLFKYFIFISKCWQSELNYFGFLRYLRHHRDRERYKAIFSKQMRAYERRWGVLVLDDVLENSDEESETSSN